MADSFKFDIAFSFLKDDEPLAVELADMLADRYKSFVYSKQQEHIAGTDGQETFTEVFDSLARCAVVLYREQWGHTPWTRTEETALKNRGLREGWDFLLLIKLDRAAKTPKWLHNSYIWHDFESYQNSGAVGAISSLIQRIGGTPRVESLDDKAARLDRHIKFEEDRRAFKHSETGVRLARTGFTDILTHLEKHCARLSLTFKRSSQPNEACVLGKKVGTLVYWRCQYANSLEGERVEITHWEGHPPMWGVHHWDKPVCIGTTRLESDLGPDKNHIWRQIDGSSDRSFSSDSLAELILRKHFEKEQEQHSR